MEEDLMIYISYAIMWICTSNENHKLKDKRHPK